MQKQFTTTRSFTINFSGTPVEIEAEIAFCAYSIMSARCPAGLPFDVSLDDLEIFESYVEALITSTTTQALSLETGQMESFTVTAWGSDILAIQNGTYSLPRHSPTWTEAAEAWHIDRQYAEAVESDAPHAAHVAGFLHPQPIPSQQGIGYRRAA